MNDRARLLRSQRVRAQRSSRFRLPPWRSRGYLPHFDGGDWLEFVTFRLDDALPQDVLSDEAGVAEVEGALDEGVGACHLRNHRVAEIVERALLHFHGVRYGLRAWVVMPNHVMS